MSSPAIQMLTPAIAQSMGIDAWGWVKFSLMLLSFLCLVTQLFLLVNSYGEKRAPSTIPSVIGFVSTLFAFMLVFKHGAISWELVVFFISIFGSTLLLHTLLIVLIKMLDVRYRKEQLIPSCSYCDYNLTDNVTGKCPECGKPIPTHLKTHLLLERIEKLD